MIIFKQTSALDSDVYRDALNLRKEVFIEEQNVPETREISDEAGALYFVGYDNSQPLVTARVQKEDSKTWHVERVAVKKSARGKKLGSQILMEVEDSARKAGISLLTLGAQDHAQEFYSKLGFKVKGEGFLDAGIEHHKMDKEIR